MAEILPEKWMRGVAVTTTILAVCTAIAGSRGTACVAKNQLLTSQEGSKWAYYQAKSIKQNLAETQRTAFSAQMFTAQNPQEQEFLQKALTAYRVDIERYDKEKNQIKQEAEALAKENRVIERRWNQFSLAVVFFQIGIMLSSVSALLRRKEMWIIGLVSGVIGLVSLVNAIFLLF